jgi:hypothetical protein
MYLKVSTKFDIGDKVWYISDNKVNENDITGVSISVDNNELVNVDYTLHFNDKVSENLLFSTKEELIKSL